MPALSPDISDAVHAVCQAGIQEVAEALSRSLDSPMTVEVEPPDRVALAELPAELNGPGLAFSLYVGKEAALFLVPESSGLVPSWCAAPDPTGQSKLSTLSQELGMLVLPDDCASDRFEWVRVPDLAKAIQAAGVVEGAAMVSFPITTTDGRRGLARLIWPASKPADLAKAATPATPPAAATPAGATPAAKQPGASVPAASRGRPASMHELPIYSRSLLRVKVPVVVTLAQKRQPVSRIVELGPGCIIQFDKSCEEMLDLHLGGRMIANGEAVKVGDKFGLRITNVVLPEERFYPMKKPS